MSEWVSRYDQQLKVPSGVVGLRYPLRAHGSTGGGGGVGGVGGGGVGGGGVGGVAWRGSGL